MTAWYGPAYDEQGKRGVLTVEAYFTTALEGGIHMNREFLADVGIPFLQDVIQEGYGISALADQIKARFEREQSVSEPDDEIHVEFREMTYRGKQILPKDLPSRTIPIDSEGDEYDSNDSPEDDEAEDDDSDWEEDEDEEDEW